MILTLTHCGSVAAFVTNNYLACGRVWMLHAGEIRGTSRCSKIQPLIDIAIPLFHQYFIPDRTDAVDEAMIAYRGRVAFRQYILYVANLILGGSKPM